MKLLRGFGVIAVLVAAGVALYLYTHRPAPPAVNESITVYYTKPDGSMVVPYSVTRGPANDARSLAFLAATQAVAGPPNDVAATRFPSGTFVRSVELLGSTAVVDLSGTVKQPAEGSFTEGGMFKALVWTMTERPESIRCRSLSTAGAWKRCPTVTWSWMSRSSVRTGSLIAALAALVLLVRAPAGADAPPTLWFAGTRLIFDAAVPAMGDLAVTTGDSGLARFLGRVGATLAWDTAQRNVVVTSADHRVIRFVLGDTHFSVGNVMQSAPFAPYVAGSQAVLPFYSIARALGVEPVRDAGDIVLQPQIYALDVKTAGKVVTVTVHAATPIRFKTEEDGDRLVLTFGGVSTSLDQVRRVDGGGLGTISIVPGGSVRGPATVVTFDGAAGGARSMLASTSSNVVVLAFGGPAADPVPEAYAAPTPAIVPIAIAGSPLPTAVPSPLPSVSAQASALPASGVQTPATLTAVDETAVGDGLSIRLAVTGGAAFEWHRLSDNRFYIDLKNVTLGFGPRDDTPPPGGVSSVRIRQIATLPIPIVRVALSLVSQRQIDVVGTADGIALAVNSNDDLEAPHVGAGEINGGLAYTPASVAALPPVTALRAGTNPKLIVIDPGHGGSDMGAAHNGLVEKDLTLDISRRLRAILISRGWQVKMTRDSDVDVFAPNDSARDELQARCDVANAAGARMFVSVHINSSTSSSINGTTSYYYKPEDEPLAAAIQRRLMSSLGTANMGTRKEAFYVIKHTSMPATLFETAFISNPSDADLLRSPAFLQRVALSIADGIADYTAATPASGVVQQ